MTRSRHLFIRNPDRENEGGIFGSGNNDNSGNADEQSLDAKEEITEKKPFAEKLREALQDWSNDDQKDQEIDDATP